MTKLPLPSLQLEAPPITAAEASLFDYSLVKLWGGFVWRSLGRHRLAGVFSGLMFFAMVILLAWIYPKKFESQSKLLASRNTVMSSVGNPHRSNDSDVEGPTRAAQETVLARDNLIALINQTKLIEHWDSHRNPVMKLKDELQQRLNGKPTEDQRLESMIGTLEKHFNVYVGDGTLVIAIYWPDGPMARQLVEAAQRNFLEARHKSEVSSIAETISILETHAVETQTTIDDAITNVERVANERASQTTKDAKDAKDAVAKDAVAAHRPRSQAAPNREALQQELSQLKFVTRTKRRAITELEEFRSRRLAELQAQLAEQKVSYSANHPLVIDSEQRIEILQNPSPQLEALKRDERSLIEEYKSRGGHDINAAVEPGGASRGPRSGELAQALSEVPPDLRDDPAITVARAQLAMATSRYQDILMRIDAARIEFDTASAAFKYRYTVVSPAQTPRAPISPNLPMILISAVLAALFFSFLTSALLDLRRGRVIEAWQVEKRFKVPVLATFNP